MEREKLTVTVETKTLDRLDRLKSKLRIGGVARSSASFGAIIDAAIALAEKDFDALAARFD